MPDYLVEMTGEVREVYAVTADSPEEAREKWADGYLVISESQGMSFYSVREDN